MDDPMMNSYETHCLASAEERIQQLESQLREANEVIAYYANYSTWMVSTQPDLFDSVKSEDLEPCEGIFNNPEQDIGGKRAREYQSKYPEGK